MTTRDLDPGELLVLSREDVEQLLTPAACLERCLDTFRWVGEQVVEQTNPVNLYIHDRAGPEPEYGHGVIQAFPAMIRPLNRAAVKWLGSYRKNAGRNLPAISAIDIVSDTESGMPLAIVDGTSVTNMRTGGHAAVGAHFLAPADTSVVAIIGCGNEGRTHLRLMHELFKIEEVRAFDISPAASRDFAQEMSELLDVKVTICDSVKATVEPAQVVCVVTTAAEPVLMEEWIHAGTHVCAATGFRDVEKSCARAFDKWVVGWYGRDLEWIDGPEVGKLGGLQRGDLGRDDIYADIATEIIAGAKVGRQSPQERTIMTHMGMPALDAAVASLVVELALSQQIGDTIRLF